MGSSATHVLRYRKPFQKWNNPLCPLCVVVFIVLFSFPVGQFPVYNHDTPLYVANKVTEDWPKVLLRHATKHCMWALSTKVGVKQRHKHRNRICQPMKKYKTSYKTRILSTTSPRAVCLYWRQHMSFEDRLVHINGNPIQS